MSHKIDGTTAASPVTGTSRVQPRTESGAASGRPATGDTVDLTDAARLMQRLEAMLAAAPTSDRARVEAIKQAVASGAYEIDPERIAAQVMHLERDLFGRS